LSYQPNEDIKQLLQRAEACPDALRALREKLAQLDLAQGAGDNQCLRSLAESSSIIFYETDDAFRYTWLNPAFEQKLGWKTEEVLGKTLGDFMSGEEKARWQERISLGAKPFQGFHFKLKAKNGATVYLVSDGVPFYDQHGVFRGMRGFGIDITRQILTEMANKKLISLHESVLEASPDAIVLVNTNEKIIAVNQRFWDMWHIPENLRLTRDLEAIRRHIREQVNMDKTHIPNIERFYKDFSEKSQDIIHLKDGRVIERFTAPQVLNGKFEGRCWYYKDITRQSTLLRRVMKQAYSDPLTGLYNRRWCENKLTRLLRGDNKNQVSFLYMDVDYFKAINDACGHVTGDRALRELSQILLSVTREMGDLCRLGGDEFGMILFGKTQKQAIEVAEKIRQAVKSYRLIQQDKEYRLGISIGLVSANRRDSTKSIFIKADEACYLAKTSGRDCLIIYHEEKERIHQSHQELAWFERMQSALANDRLQLWQQPVYTRDKSQECYQEILVRHVGEDGGITEPKEFMPAIERFGLAEQLDRWVIESLFSWLCQQDPNSERVYSINLSGQSITKPAFLDFVLQQFATYRIPYARICFEITENEIIQNLDRARNFMQIFRDNGCHFALDDFGKGLTSFAYLKDLPFDYIKIDGEFVKGLNDDKINEAIVKSVVYIAQVINKATIAEHVEDAQTMDTLSQLGVNLFQGHHLARPQPLA
jgi:diguanylate cyclase (GGDEF)-like protein/PAS domain S-box-containing protein